MSGRTYPVEIFYRPLTSKDEDDAEVELTDAIVDAADELARYGEGDILVFLPGEREIREAAEALRKSTLRRNDEILPLFARLSHAEQHKIFHPSGAKRRIVLATNVAETSLTVPGIKYVIDTGLARVKRYSARAKVEQLHVEKISQAAARQRSGRCGAFPQASVSDCFQKKISTAAQNSPTQKSSAATSLPSSCAWHR
ncbi:helicase-related protein [Neisseria subflava]|uniref:helicase-related protein n=1 Tax=Neisseria subflava TaxID=28449 RepID=UPI0032E45884